jgi:uncharacterized protein
MNNNKILSREADFKIDDESRSFSGYGIVFNSDSVPLVIHDRDNGDIEVYEQITRASIEGADMTDAIAAINHDFGKILGRSTAGTLELSIDDKGVMYRVPDLPNTTYANDLRESTSRGDIRGSSFTFSIDWEAGYDIEERSDGGLTARPKKIKRVYEMGPVTNPAYPETTAENRSSALFTAIGEFLQRKNEPEKPEQISQDKMNDLEKKLRLSEEEAAL